MTEDTTVKKVSSEHSPRGEMGQIYLVTGKAVSMRLWHKQPADEPKEPSRRDYETVGYVIDGRAELKLGGQTLVLEPGDSWLVPRNVEHSYHIRQPFTAIEATSPPALAHGRDETSSG